MKSSPASALTAGVKLDLRKRNPYKEVRTKERKSSFIPPLLPLAPVTLAKKPLRYTWNNVRVGTCRHTHSSDTLFRILSPKEEGNGESSKREEGTRLLKKGGCFGFQLLQLRWKALQAIYFPSPRRLEKSNWHRVLY